MGVLSALLFFLQIGLLAAMSMALMIAMKRVPEVTKRLQEKYGKLWETMDCGKCVIIVTHSKSVSTYADQLLVLDRGRL